MTSAYTAGGPEGAEREALIEQAESTKAAEYAIRSHESHGGRLDRVCKCGTPLCPSQFLLRHIESLRQAHGQKVADLAKETARNSATPSQGPEGIEIQELLHEARHTIHERTGSAPDDARQSIEALVIGGWRPPVSGDVLAATAEVLLAAPIDRERPWVLTQKQSEWAAEALARRGLLATSSQGSEGDDRCANHVACARCVPSSALPLGVRVHPSPAGWSRADCCRASAPGQPGGVGAVGTPRIEDLAKTAEL